MELEAGDLQILVDTGDVGGCEGEREEVRQWEPIPILGEDGHAHNCLHVQIASLGL